MGRMYKAQLSAIAVTAIQDLWEINAPSDAVVVLHSCVIGQNTDFGDAAAEGLPVQISRATGTAGSGGSGVTANPLEVGMPAYGGTVERNNTTQAGTTTVLHADVFNIQGGWLYIPTPEERIVISPSGVLVIELPVAPADSITVYSTITFEEIGG